MKILHILTKYVQDLFHAMGPKNRTRQSAKGCSYETLSAAIRDNSDNNSNVSPTSPMMKINDKSKLRRALNRATRTMVEFISETPEGSTIVQKEHTIDELRAETRRLQQENTSAMQKLLRS